MPSSAKTSNYWYVFQIELTRICNYPSMRLHAQLQFFAHITLRQSADIQ